jgi:hypothetical protein
MRRMTWRVICVWHYMMGIEWNRTSLLQHQSSANINTYTPRLKLNPNVIRAGPRAP